MAAIDGCGTGESKGVVISDFELSRLQNANAELFAQNEQLRAALAQQAARIAELEAAMGWRLLDPTDVAPGASGIATGRAGKFSSRGYVVVGGNDRRAILRAGSLVGPPFTHWHELPALPADGGERG